MAQTTAPIAATTQPQPADPGALSYANYVAAVQRGQAADAADTNTSESGSRNTSAPTLMGEADYNNLSGSQKYAAITGTGADFGPGGWLKADDNQNAAYTAKYGAPTGQLVFGYGDPSQFDKGADSWAVDPSKILRNPDGSWVMDSANVDPKKWAAMQGADARSGANLTPAMMAALVLGVGTLGGAFLGEGALAGAGADGVAAATPEELAAADETGGGLLTNDITNVAQYAGADETGGMAGSAADAGTTAGTAGSTIDTSLLPNVTSPTIPDVGAPPAVSAPGFTPGSVTDVPGAQPPAPVSSAPLPPGTQAPAPITDLSTPAPGGIVNNVMNGAKGVGSWWDGLSPTSKQILASGAMGVAKGVAGASAQKQALDAQTAAEERARQDAIRRGHVDAVGNNTFTPKPLPNTGIINSQLPGG